MEESQIMTKRDYIAIARGISGARKRLHFLNGYNSGVDIVDPILNEVVQFISRELAADNPRFDKETFVEACMKMD